MGPIRVTSQRILKSNLFNQYSKNPKYNFILKVMEEEFGYIAAHSILSYVSRTTMKPMVKILSDFDTFSRILKQVYTEETAEKEILERLRIPMRRHKMKLLSYLKEIDGIVVQATDQGRDELNWKEVEYITRITNRMLKEANMELADVAYLLPELIPQETVGQILKRNGGAY